MTNTYLTTDQVDTLSAIVEELDGQLTTDYSGRGMYGRKCIGVTVDGSGTDAAFRLGLELGRLDDDADLADAFDGEAVAVDSMGLGTIIYWPGIAAADEN